jgi:hypothetical protein
MRDAMTLRKIANAARVDVDGGVERHSAKGRFHSADVGIANGSGANKSGAISFHAEIKRGKKLALNKS